MKNAPVGQQFLSVTGAAFPVKWVLTLLVVPWLAGGQDPLFRQASPGRFVNAPFATTTEADSSDAYRVAALDSIIREANRVASELGLDEKMPIEKSSIVESYITPGRFAKPMRAIGNISTKKFRYYFSLDNKFSFLTRTDLQHEYALLEKQYSLPMSAVNTNAAYQLATQFLTLASMDVRSLNRNCRIEVLPWTPSKTNFVPVYWVRWYLNREIVAMIELLEPTRSLRQLRVERPEYILRRSIEITNAVGENAKTNATIKPQ